MTLPKPARPVGWITRLAEVHRAGGLRIVDDCFDGCAA
jgi:hypothetical protein